MERSIETARRRRIHDPEDQPRPRPAAIEPVTHGTNGNGASHANHGDDEMPRRKARPKRATPDVRRFDGEYRAEAV